ncbi:MAG TPA: hypothetical protein VK427_24910 [Kofleriaceae bacterium]|nr:hypothetical protein [Kofleriaceae bacterium]
MTIDALFGTRRAELRGDVVTEDEAAALRTRLASWQRYTLLDRGSYDFIDNIDEPALFAKLGFDVFQARALRLVPGDYVLAHHDQLHDDLPLELVLDLSPAPVPAEIHYRRRGHVFFRAPCVPRSLAIVERGPTVTRNHTYVSQLNAGAVVARLVMLARAPSG